MSEEHRKARCSGLCVEGVRAGYCGACGNWLWNNLSAMPTPRMGWVTQGTAETAEQERPAAVEESNWWDRLSPTALDLAELREACEDEVAERHGGRSPDTREFAFPTTVGGTPETILALLDRIAMLEKKEEGGSMKPVQNRHVSSKLGPHEVLLCACGCGQACVVSDLQLTQAAERSAFYLGGHGPLGASKPGTYWVEP